MEGSASPSARRPAWTPCARERGLKHSPLSRLRGPRRGPASGPAGSVSSPAWPSFPISPCFVLGPAFPPSHVWEATLAHVPPQVLSALCGDAREAAAHRGASPWACPGPWPGQWERCHGRGVCCHPSLLAPRRPRGARPPSSGRIWLSSPQTFCFIHLGKNFGKDPFPSKGEGQRVYF